MVKIKGTNCESFTMRRVENFYSSTPELNPFIFSRVLIQTARVLMLLDGAKYCRKVQPCEQGVTTSQTTDNRSTDRRICDDKTNVA